MKQRALWSAVLAPDLPFAAGRACAPSPSGNPDDRLVVRRDQAKAAPHVEKATADFAEVHPRTAVGFVARPFDGGSGYGVAKA
jgi:hypothetical protein